MRNLLKKRIILLLTIILGLGLSLSAIYFMYYRQDARRSSLSSGLITIDFEETSNVILSSNLPVVDAYGLEDTTPYSFTVKNTSKIPVDVEMKLDVKSNTTIPLGAIRYGVFINDKKVKKDYVHDDKVLYTFEELLVDETIEVKIYFWVDYYYDVPNQIFNASILVEGTSRDILWEPVTVTFDANGGTVDTTTKEVGVGSNYGRLPTPTREGYTFDGWTIPDAEYQELEYIESTGTQYIDTGVKLYDNQNHEITIDFVPTEFYNYNTLYGSTYDADTFEGWIYSSGQLASRYDYARYGNDNQILLNTRYLYYLKKENNSLSKYVNNELIGTNSVTSDLTNEKKNGVFLLFLSGSDYGKYKLYNCKLSKNNELVRDFVPVIETSTGKIGLLDAKNNKFYGNDGEGEFLAGPLLDKTTSTSRVITSTNHTIKANWVPSTYTVTFDANGGTVDTLTKQVTYSSTYGTLPTPTRSGYTFMGWNGKNMFNEEEILMAIAGAKYENNHYVFTLGSAHSKYGVSGKEIPIYNFKENTQYSVTIMGYNDECGTNSCYTSNQTRILLQPIYNEDATIMFFSLNSLQESAVFYTTAKGKNISYFKMSYGYGGDTYTHISHIQLEEGTEATEYEPYYVTSSTKVTQTKNHTLTAIWKENT